MSSTSRLLHPSNARSSVIPTGSGAADVGWYRALNRAISQSSDRLVGALVDLRRLARHESAPALDRWFRAYSRELRGHLAAERTIFFPALASRVPAFAECTSRLELDHARIEDLIDVTGHSLRRLADAVPTWNDDHAAAVAQVIELRNLLDDHVDDIDREVLPLFERHFSATETTTLHERARAIRSLTSLGFHVPWFVSANGDHAATAVATLPTTWRAVHRIRRRSYRRLAARAFVSGTRADRSPAHPTGDRVTTTRSH